MRSVQVVEAKARFSALLEAVESGETIAITRHGRIVARLVPDQPRMAVDVFRPFWKDKFEDCRLESAFGFTLRTCRAALNALYALGAVVVTDNLRPFSRVPRLMVENWLEVG